MQSLLYLIIQIIELYKIVLIIYVIASWLVSFKIINTSNRFIYSLLDALYRICEPSLRIVKRYIPNFGNFDISPIIVYIALEFIRRLLIEYWPR
ncbi:MAG: hypothetical protein CFH21_00901 [Alphaproteobacteria bacterium MarineAlpha5_Bin11]|nr:hypothetical protein [Pelagibacteraceae bacterium]PPR43113.1 MAG: hypothetical protein CFH21_00901 [Alphaproteobacteria bacterium MarineAlpha5_Bin11]PPR51901.1 MAG: hypothetical protein CFH20_00320 [Alphaproteobacteria bacterium MarineAlpha5_Bin10]